MKKNLILDAPKTTAAEAAYRIIQQLEESDFQFEVTVCGRDWNVYRFVLNDQPGQIAIRLSDTSPKHVMVGYFEAGDKSVQEIEHALRKELN